jgi:hypothetical protein
VAPAIALVPEGNIVTEALQVEKVVVDDPDRTAFGGEVGAAPTTVNSSVRTREYLTTAEIERLMAAARQSSRYGHRDATMILIGYRHGLRVILPIRAASARYSPQTSTRPEDSRCLTGY